MRSKRRERGWALRERLAPAAMSVLGLIFVAAGLLTPWATIRNAAAGWGVVGGVVFASFGTGAILLAVRMNTEISREARLRVEHPGQPWRWRDDWAAARVRSQGVGVAVPGLLLLVLPVLGLLSLLAATALEEAARDWRVLLVAGVAVGIAAWVVAKWLWRVRHRGWAAESVFVPAALPLRVGEAFEGVLEVPLEIGGATEVQLTLSCLRAMRDYDGTRWVVVWGQEQRLSLAAWQRAERCWRVPVRLVVPADLPGSDSYAVRWDLMATATPNGRKFEEVFTVPVFAADSGLHRAET